MTKINYNQSHKTLAQTCERYLVHNQAQLDALIPISPSFPEDSFFDRAYQHSPGFLGWVSCKYAELMDKIIFLNPMHNRDFDHCEDVYPPCENKFTFVPRRLKFDDMGNMIVFNAYDEYPHVDPKLVLDRLTVLLGLLNHIMVKENKEVDFEKKLQDYKPKNESDYLCAKSDSLSIKIYDTLKDLRELTSFINDTLPEYQSRRVSSLVRVLNESFPTFEGYIKGLAVRELKSILDDTTSNAENSVKAMASQLKNKATLEILGINRQSQTEHILKVLSVALIAVGIGIIPTVILAAKRLYDTGGTSMNFFKPLSKNLCEDAESITAQVDLEQLVI
jgi:hypothetical protein